MKAVHQAFATLVCILALSMAGCSSLDGESDEIIQKGSSIEVASIEEASQRRIEESTAIETEVPTDMAPQEKYYGYYQITEFLPSLSWLRGSSRYDWLPEQEADMLIGRVIELSKDRLITYDSLRKLGKKDGRVAFPGNYFIEEIIIEKPQYSWELVDTNTIDTFYTSDIIPYLDLIEGKISI